MQSPIQNLTRGPPRLPFWLRGSPFHTLLQLLMTLLILSPPHKITQRPHPPNTVLPPLLSTASTRRQDNLTRPIPSQRQRRPTFPATQSTSPPAPTLTTLQPTRSRTRAPMQSPLRMPSPPASIQTRIRSHPQTLNLPATNIQTEKYQKPQPHWSPAEVMIKTNMS